MDTIMEALATGTESGIHLATVERLDDSGTPWVRLPRRRPLAARWVSGVTAEQLRAAQASGTPVVAALTGKSQVVILGVLASGPSAPAPEVKVDGKKVTLSGDEEVTLKCGKASITLTAAGKVLIKGEYLLSRSSGVNRIKGGAVQIN
ncbi:MAG TPA: hypothetical protein VNM14_00980 [Planctomycetota bacterium]|nr:hypothetical protein [Planctomycetota bacterium]